MNSSSRSGVNSVRYNSKARKKMQSLYEDRVIMVICSEQLAMNESQAGRM